MEQALHNELISLVGKEQVRIQEPMSEHTTFRIGGNADFFIMPTHNEQVQKIVMLAKEHQIPYLFIGNGSNLLVSDEGIRGFVIEMTQMNRIEIEEKRVKAQAGVTLAELSKAVARQSLTGFEFAEGIPGTLGGAVTMNAGAYGGEMKDVIIEATVLDNYGHILTLSKEELELGYRTSIVGRDHYVVLEVVMELEEGNQEEIFNTMKDLSQRRREKQPLEYPSAGSTFKRPVGYFAGKLIDDTGLRGFGVGGAKISDKHCGFVINTGNATAKDVRDLIQEVQKRVEDKFGVHLETEVKFIGFENE